MAPWIKRPKVGDRELQNRRQGFARAQEFGIFEDEDTKPTTSTSETLSEESFVNEDMDGLFDEPKEANVTSNNQETTKEEETMSTLSQEELLKQQMEQFMAQSAVLQNLIDAQNQHNSMNGNAVHMPNMQTGAPTMQASNAFVQPSFNTGFAQPGYAGTGYSQPLPNMGYTQPMPQVSFTQPIPQTGYAQTGYAQTGYGQNAFPQYNSNYQPQVVFQQTAPMPDLSQLEKVNATAVNPSEEATPLKTPIEPTADGAATPRYPYPAPDMQPGMGQMPESGIDGIVTNNIPSFAPGIHTVDLTGIADDIKTTVDARVDGLQSDVEGIRSDVDEMKVQVNTVRQGIDNVQSNVSGIRSDMEAIRTGFTSDLSGVQDAIRQELEAATAGIAASTRAYFEENKASLDETRSALAEANRTIERNTESFAGLKEQLDLLTSRTESIDNVSEKMDMSMSELKSDLSDKIHTEDVKCFRNIQSSMKEQTDATDAGLNNIANQIGERLAQTEGRVDDHSKKITAVLIISIISFVGVIGVLLLEAGII